MSLAVLLPLEGDCSAWMTKDDGGGTEVVPKCVKALWPVMAMQLFLLLFVTNGRVANRHNQQHILNTSDYQDKLYFIFFFRR